ncbi:MAG: TIGR03936 family radical SAM-associated protein [Oscillospiraceae bacterium]|nr:TIGR03936 family radical SAM-associated protein [Oscillospiraceae bacterium]
MKFTNVRVFFSKTGNAKYISHLDLYRAFGRALKRSALPLWVTEGFNPHIYTTFALPLALGIEGKQESVDIRLTQEVTFDEVVLRLNAVMPTGLCILRAAVPVRNANDITKARYFIESADITAFDEFFAAESIEIVKKSKTKTQTLDVKPLSEWDSATRTLTLPAGNELTINPLTVLAQGHFRSVTRSAILCGDGAYFM